jgi:hypothetical protein
VRVTRVMPLLIIAAVLTVLWVTASASVPFMSGGPAIRPIEPTPTTSATLPPARHAPRHQRQTVDPPSERFLFLTGFVLLCLLLLVLVAFLVSVAWRAERKQYAHHLAAGDDPDAVDALEVPVDLVQTTEQQLERIREGTPRNAIVACWWELERSCAATGFPRAAAETSTEFTARALGRFVLEPDVVESLAALYREARFSEHELTERQRDQAVAALETILSGLRTRQASIADKAARA